MGRNILLISFFLLCKVSSGQEALSLERAFEKALQSNFSIQIATLDAKVSANNNSIGAAGMLPDISAVVQQNNQVTDTKQKFLNGNENNRNAASSNQFSGTVDLGWTLFDGMKMFASKSKLEELEAMGKIKLQQQIEGVYSRVAKAYLDVLLSREQLKSGKQFVEISEKRLEFAQTRRLAGKSAKSEVLNAQVNLNSDLAAYKKLQTQFSISKLSLIQLMGEDVNYSFEPSDSLPPGLALQLEDLKAAAQKNNKGLQAAKLNKEISQYQLKEIRSERYPSLEFKTGYFLNQQESQAGFLQYARNNGFHYGASIGVNVFNGGDVNRRVNNAGIAIKSADLIYRDSLLKLEVALSQAYLTYQTNLELYNFEQENVKVAQQNFELSREQYEQGIISNNDLRIAQVNFIQNVNRELLAAYEARWSEIELKRLSGTLFKP